MPNTRQWIPAIAGSRKRRMATAVTALAFASAGMGSIASVIAPSAPTGSLAVVRDPASTSFVDTLQAPAVDEAPLATSAGPAPAEADGTTSAPMPAQASIDHAFELQSTYYTCGPAAMRVALSARGKLFSEDRLAAMLGTTTAGTPSAFDMTRVLNDQLGENRYRTVEFPTKDVSGEQTAQLKSDILTTLRRGDTLVANVIGDTRDNNGELHSYPVGHYLNVVGYVDGGEMVRIADSADAVGSAHYDLSVVDLAKWIASRGYSA